MSMATRTDTRSPALHVADSHDLIRVHGARVNNLKDVSVEIPKRRLTVFTGVSGSGKSSLVFGTIAAESQRLINETYSAFVQGFMPTLARPEVDVLEGLTTAIIVDQQRMGADARSTVGTATDANAMLRILFSRLGQPHIGPPSAYSFNVPSVRASGAITVEARGQQDREGDLLPAPAACARAARAGARSPTSTCPSCTTTASRSTRARSRSPATAWTAGTAASSAAAASSTRTSRSASSPRRELHDLLHKEPTKIKVDGINLTYEGLIPKIQKSMLSKDVDALQPHIRAFVERAVTFTDLPRVRRHPAQRGGPVVEDQAGSTSPTPARCRSATWPSGSAASTSRRWRRCSRRCGRPSTRSWRSGWATSRSTGRRARCRAARRSASR